MIHRHLSVDPESDETEILKELIPRVFKVVDRVAKSSRNSVERGKWPFSLV